MSRTRHVTDTHSSSPPRCHVLCMSPTLAQARPHDVTYSACHRHSLKLAPTMSCTLHVTDTHSGSPPRCHVLCMSPTLAQARPHDVTYSACHLHLLRLAPTMSCIHLVSRVNGVCLVRHPFHWTQVTISRSACRLTLFVLFSFRIISLDRIMGEIDKR